MSDLTPDTLDLAIDDLYELSGPNVSTHVDRLRPYVAAWKAKLEAMGRVVEVAEEAERIANEAHLAADHYAYDLMRTVLRPLVGEMERSVEQALEEEQE